MSKEFCLLDEPWLPVRLADGRIEEVGLLDVFARSREIVSLADTAPPNLMAHYRLLLAITHRALTAALGGWKEKDRVRWFRDGLPHTEIYSYLEAWRERFWLFHAEHPFMQVAVLAQAEETRDKRKPWTQIALASACGNAPMVFDHSCDLAPTAIPPAEALATLLGFLQFTPGGLVKTLRDSDKAAALSNTAAVLPLGENLAQTLCLALHPSPRASADPDLPSWERAAASVADLCSEPVLATGPNDRYTRLSRAVLLCREPDGSVRWLHYAAGLALAEDPNAPDPMASFRTGSSGLVRLSFTEGRALWRDLPALVPNTGEGSQAGAVVQYAAALHQSLAPFESVYQPLLVAGLASDQAKLLRWRAERISLPSVLLLEPQKALYLRERMAAAETLFFDLKRLAVGMTTESLPDAASKDTRSRARALVETGPLAPTYFSCAERALPELLHALEVGALDKAETLWSEALRRSAQLAWAQLLAEQGKSPRALRADARYWPRLHGLLNKQLPRSTEVSTDKEAVS